MTDELEVLQCSGYLTSDSRSILSMYFYHISISDYRNIGKYIVISR